MTSTMFRTTAARTLLHNATRSPLTHTTLRAAYRTAARPQKSTGALALVLRQPVQNNLVRYQSSSASSKYGLVKEAELAYQKEKLAAEPEIVSTSSSIHPVQGEVGLGDEADREVDMTAGIKSDFITIKDTFTLQDVPKEALYVGLAGVIPYLATSLSTVFLSFDIQYAAHHGQGFLLDGQVAEQLLHIIEPIQLGYGASIISFLGAIHWGLEWAGFGGTQGYPRYAIGIVATAVAWPTLLLSAEVGLITQFLAFTFLYYVDARASNNGWAPSWYGIYRFVLTFVVGASIVASLIGRGQIADLIEPAPGPAQKLRELREGQLAELERTHAEDKARAASAGDEDEEEEEEE